MIKDRNLDLEAFSFYNILKPDVAVDSIVAAEDISGGDVATCTLVKTFLDYPRNLLYTITDDSGSATEATFVVVGLDQFGKKVTETTAVTYAAAVSGEQIFSVITSIATTLTDGEAASDTADVGVSIEADVASFGLPNKIGAITDVKGITFLDSGATAAQNIDSTSIVVARHCYRPEQTVEIIDDYIIRYKSTAHN